MSRSRTSLGRSSLNANIGLPPSPQRLGSPIPTFETMLVPSQAVPNLDDDELLTRTIPLNLDQELIEAGYTPLSKMVVVTPKGESQVRYVKAENSLGEPVYIALDVDNVRVSQSPHDHRFKESRSPLAISPEDKDTAFTKAGMGVAGVAFECPNGLCTILRDERMNAPREQHFVLMNTVRTEETTIVSSFPVVKVSDIRLNAEACLKNVDLAMRKIRNCTLLKCIHEIEEVEKKFDHVSALFKETLQAKQKVIEEYSRSINFLEDTYDRCSSAKCPDSDKLKAIIYNIEKRNAKFPHLIDSCKQIAALDIELESIACGLEKSKRKLEKKFRYLGCVYEPRGKKHHHKCAWEEYDDDAEDDDS